MIKIIKIVKKSAKIQLLIKYVREILDEPGNYPRCVF